MPNFNTEKKRQLNLIVPIDLYQAAAEQAQEEGVSLSCYVRRQLRVAVAESVISQV